MTLDTKIAIGGGAVNAREVFELCRAMVNTPDGVEPRTETFIGPESAKHLHNPGGIGADGWLITWYGADGPLSPHACADDCYLDDPEDMAADGDDPNASRCMYGRERDNGDPQYSGWASMIVSIDTAYGHRGPNGEGCADLHARYIFVLAAYCDAKNLDLKWQNEFTGEWFDRLDGLDDFGDPAKANDPAEWAQQTVLPKVAARLGKRLTLAA